MFYKPYQQIIRYEQGVNQTVSIPGSVYLRIQSDPNSKFYFSIDFEEEDNKIYLDKTGSYEIDLTDLSIMNLLYIKNLEPNQVVIIDTLREPCIGG